jgi:N-acetylmuramoyl-L-alanine amidase
VLVALIIVVSWLTSSGHGHRRTPALQAAPDPTGSTTGSATGSQLGGTTFSPGACMALSPTAASRGSTVFLDAGHGGPDPGATVATQKEQRLNEKDVTLPVVLDAARLLRADGYRVVVSRTSDTSVARLGPTDVSSGTLTLQGEHKDTAARVDCANLAQARALVSVHFNAFSDGSAGGSLTTYDDVRTFAAANQRLAQLVETQVVSTVDATGLSVTDRGVVTDNTVGADALSPEAAAYGRLLLLGPAAPGWLDHPSTMPGALVEPLFLSNPAEASAAVTPACQRAIAGGIAKAVDQFLNAQPA